MKKEGIAILFFLLPVICYSQVHTTLFIGSGVSYADAKNTEKYLPIVRPNRIFFKTKNNTWLYIPVKSCIKRPDIAMP